MNLKILSAVSAALALGGVSGQAFALGSPALTFELGGATSTERVLADALLDGTAGAAGGLCGTATIAGTPADVAEVYTTHVKFGTQFADPLNSAARDSTENYAIVCKTRANIAAAPGGGTAIPAGTIVQLRKNSGGSGDAAAAINVTAVANNATKKWVDVSACKAAVTPVGISLDGGRVDYYLYAGCAQTSGSVIPQAGIADLEPKFVYATPTSGPATGKTLATFQTQVTVNQTVGVVFAVGVSKPLFTALQTAEGIAPNATVASITEAAMPSLSKGQLAKIFRSGAGGQDAGTLINVATPGDSTIYVCRRGDTSGTQNAFQIYFLGQKCGGTAQFVTASSAATGVGNSGATWDSGNPVVTGASVFAGASTDEVKACLDYHSGQGHYAVGVLSTENVYTDDATTNTHRFIKIDGNAPSVENAIAGRYGLWVENQFYTPRSTNVAGTGVAGPLTGQTLSFVTSLRNKLGNANLVKGALVNYDWGYGGIVALPSSSTTPPTSATHAAVASTPVNPARLATSYTGATNSCALPSIVSDYSPVR